MRTSVEDSPFTKACAEARFEKIVAEAGSGKSDTFEAGYYRARVRFLCLHLEVAERRLGNEREDNAQLRKLLESRSLCPNCYDSGKIIEDGTTVFCDCPKGEAAGRDQEAEGVADRAERGRDCDG
jgi:hypothetical protein